MVRVNLNGLEEETKDLIATIALIALIAEARRSVDHSITLLDMRKTSASFDLRGDNSLKFQIAP
jgi:hypothetical protein